MSECLVHSLEKSSQFQLTVNLLRREKKYHAAIYQELPSRCCSCDEQKGKEKNFSLIDVNPSLKSISRIGRH